MPTNDPFVGGNFSWSQGGPLADALFVTGGWWLVTHPGRTQVYSMLLTPDGKLSPGGLLIILAFYALFAPSILLGLIPQRLVLDGHLLYSDGWWLTKVFFLPAAAIRDLFCRQKCAYAVRLWGSGHREASQQELVEAQALFPEHEVGLVLLESRLHESSKEPGPAAALFQRALEKSDELALAVRLSVLAEHAATLTSAAGPDHARRIAEVLLAKAATTAERVEVLDALACLPILHQGTKVLLPDAERWCAEACALAPEQVTLRGTWGALLVELNREKEAVPILQDVLATTHSDNDRGIASFYLAMAARRLGRRREMLRYRQQTLRWCQVPVLLSRLRAELPAA